jgi:L-seryl-tRNA(Ser) seleniumtransferase
MGTKPLDFLNRIPNVSDLLEKQPVRALTDRWNRSVVAAGVRSFLDELRTDLRRRAAEVPTIRELAERAAQYVVSQQQAEPKTFINATGRILGAPWAGVPLADRALERSVVVARDFLLEPGKGDVTATDMADEIEAHIRRLTGAQAAASVHSYGGALWLTLAALASNREVLVSRSEVGEVSSAAPLPRLAAAAGAILRDVGTANRTAAADYEVATSPRAALLLKLDSDEYRIVGQTASTELEELVALTRDRDLMLAYAVDGAPLVNPPAPIEWPRRSVRAILETGVDLVVVRGDGLVGGPTCGLVIGRQDIVERVTAHPLYKSWQLDSLRSAALVGTLQIHANGGDIRQELPVWQLLSTPLENLQNRAERIAPQLAQATGIASATVAETRSLLTAALADNGWPSFGIALSAADGNIGALEARLGRADRPVLGRIEGDRLVLDLRTVFPRQDRHLVEAIAGGGSKSDETASPPPSIDLPAD